MADKKQVILIGLGRVGLAIGSRLVENGYIVNAFDRAEPHRTAAAGSGVLVHDSIEDAITAQMGTKVVFMMVPPQKTHDLVEQIRRRLSPDDVIIDAANSFFHDSINRHHDLADDGMHFVDCGTLYVSHENTFDLTFMIGGSREIIENHKELFIDIAGEQNVHHVGEAGSGHFSKMVHTAIEYGMIGAIAEGVNVLEEHKEGLGININEVLSSYRNDNVIEDKFIDWLSEAYNNRDSLESIARVPKEPSEMDMEYLVEHEHVRVLDAALLQRKLTRLEPSFLGSLIAGMKNTFAGTKKNDKT